MTDGDSEYDQIKEIFLGALELGSQRERADYLEEACGENRDLHRTIKTLVREYEEVDGESASTAAGSSSDPDPTTENPGTIIGRYKLLEKIGEGGFGSVYMADQTEPVSRRVALKLVKPGMDSKEVIARFEAERQALALMDDPNIAKVFDAGTTDAGRPYFVMELVNGIPITRFCNEQRLGTRQRLEIFLDVCSAVQHAHQKGVIHRDLKPSNILVTLHGDKAVPKVIDFGVAKATQQQLTDKTLFTRFEQFIGTPVYMSPEQAVLSGLDIDTRSDVYSLGVLLYELLTGKPPFDAKSLMSAGYDEMRRIIREDEPPKPSSRLSTMAGEDRVTVAKAHHTDPDKLGKLVRGDLDWIVMKAIEKDRSRRYETANALGLDIRRHLNDDPVRAAAPTVAYKLQKFVRRNRSAVLVVAAVGTMLILGTAISSYFAVAATRAKNLEAEAKDELRVQLGETQNAREAENTQRIRAEDTVQHLQLNQAKYHVQAGDLHLGLAYLARILRDHPDNAVAAARLMDLLIFRQFPSLVSEPMRHEEALDLVKLAPGGLVLATTSNEMVQFWDARTGKPTGVRLPHESRVNFVSFSPDGKSILTASQDGSARVWEVRSGRGLAGPLQHEKPVNTAVFSPDGERVVTTSWDKTARLWDVRTGVQIGEPMQHGDQVFSAEFSPDGRLIVTASRDQSAGIWDARTAEPLGDPLRYHSAISSAEFSADGERVLTSSYNGLVLLWDLASRELIGTPMSHEARIATAKFSPDGRRVVTASFDNRARLWDGHTGRPIGEPMRHQAPVWWAEFSQDGERVVTASQDRKACVWSGRTGERLGEPMLHQAALRFAEFSPDGLSVVTSCRDLVARIWDVRSRPRGEPMRHAAPVVGADFSSDGRRVITASQDKTARLWSAPIGLPLGEPLVHGNYVQTAQFGPDNLHVVTASVNNRAQVWDVQSGQPLGEPMRHQHWVDSAVFSPDGRHVLTVCYDLTARLWDAKTSLPVGEPMRHTKRIHTARFSRDGRRVVTASRDQTAQVWDAITGEPVGSVMRHEGEVVSAEFSPDRTKVCTASLDRTVRFWDAETGLPVGAAIHHGEFPFQFALFSPDGARVVTVSEDHVARLWDAERGSPLGEPMRHAARITSAHFDREGKRLVTGCHDKSARVWDGHNGQPLAEPLRHADWVVSARFSPDGSHLVTASQDNTAKIWETPTFPLPVPAWVADWAESVGGVRLTPEMHIETVAYPEVQEIKEQIAAGTEAGDYTDASRWFFADPATRTISPWSTITVNDYVARRIDEGTRASLEEAIMLSPINGLALARRARLLLDQDASGEPGTLATASLSARLAVRWSPTQPESWRAFAETQLAAGRRDRAGEAVNRALELQPDAAWALEMRKKLREEAE